VIRPCPRAPKIPFLTALCGRHTRAQPNSRDRTIKLAIPPSITEARPSVVLGAQLSAIMTDTMPPRSAPDHPDRPNNLSVMPANGDSLAFPGIGWRVIDPSNLIAPPAPCFCSNALNQSYDDVFPVLSVA